MYQMSGDNSLAFVPACVGCVCVCVHPWTKGFPPPLFSPFFHHLPHAGALSTPWQTQCNEAMPWSGKHGLITRVYLQQFGTVEDAVQCALFVSMVLHDTSHKPTAVLRRFAADFECQIVFECNCQQCSTILFSGLCHLAVPSPSFPSWKLSH